MPGIRILILSLIFLQQICLAQSIQIKGTVWNELTTRPVPDANIRVYGTSQGTPTDKNGSFTLVLAKLPATIVISCIGYDQAVYDILKKSATPLRVLLRPVTYVLKEVEISSASHSVLYQDKTYSVLDYELMDDNVLLLVFRNMVQRAGMVLLSRGGDTLAVSDLPELPPQLLYKDFLSYVHYYAKTGETYQCFYDQNRQSIDFLYPMSIDSLEKIVRPFLFRISGRLYFQETVVNGFGTSIGYYSKDRGKLYIKSCVNDHKISEYLDDQEFYYKWNSSSGVSNLLTSDDIESDAAFDFSTSRSEGGGYGKNEARAHQFEYFNMIFPLIKLNDDTIVFFNFGSDLLEMLDPDGNVIRTIPISFHKESTTGNRLENNDPSENSGWRWGIKILADEATHFLYTIYLRNGMVKISKIDPKTGNLGGGTIIPFPFPEKIKIYKGEAFFLCKESGSNENWKLVKCSVQ